MLLLLLAVVQAAANNARNSITQPGRRGDKLAAIDNTQVNAQDASVSKTGRGTVAVVQAAVNNARNTIRQ